MDHIVADAAPALDPHRHKLTIENLHIDRCRCVRIRRGQRHPAAAPELVARCIERLRRDTLKALIVRKLNPADIGIPRDRVIGSRRRNPLSQLIRSSHTIVREQLCTIRSEPLGIHIQTVLGVVPREGRRAIRRSMELREVAKLQRTTVIHRDPACPGLVPVHIDLLRVQRLLPKEERVLDPGENNRAILRAVHRRHERRQPVLFDRMGPLDRPAGIKLHHLGAAVTAPGDHRTAVGRCRNIRRGQKRGFTPKLQPVNAPLRRAIRRNTLRRNLISAETIIPERQNSVAARINIKVVILRRGIATIRDQNPVVGPHRIPQRIQTL